MTATAFCFSFETPKQQIGFGEIFGLKVSYGEDKKEVYLPFLSRTGKWFEIAPECFSLNILLEKTHHFSLGILFSLDPKPADLSIEFLKTKCQKYDLEIENTCSFEEVKNMCYEIRIFSPAKFHLLAKIIRFKKSVFEREIEVEKAQKEFRQNVIRFFNTLNPKNFQIKTSPLSTCSCQALSMQLEEKDREGKKVHQLYKQALKDRDAKKIRELGQKKIELAREIIELKKMETGK